MQSVAGSRFRQGGFDRSHALRGNAARDALRSNRSASECGLWLAVDFVRVALIVPTLCVGMQPGTLCVPIELPANAVCGWQSISSGRLSCVLGNVVLRRYPVLDSPPVPPA